MRRWLLSILLLTAATGCTVCERDSAADGVYTLLTDCAGEGLVRGNIEIGPFTEDAPATTTLRATGCESDGEVHTLGSADAGADPGGPATACTQSSYHLDSSECPQTTAVGNRLLGLPAHVTVLGARDFELHGELAGRVLDCARERFGDEKLLLCRESGRLACVAVVERD